MNSLYRSRENRMIAGVAGGIAEYFDVDVVLVRLVWILTIFMNGAGFLAYIIAAVIIPREQQRPPAVAGGDQNEAETEAGPERQPQGQEITEQNARARDRRRRNAGLLIIGLGIVFLANQTLPWRFFYLSWPFLLIILGLYILLRDGRE